MVTVNQMNRDIAEVNGSNPECYQAPGYEARVWDQESTSPNGVGADMVVNSLAPLCKYLP